MCLYFQDIAFEGFIICLSREGFSLANICGIVLFVCLKEGDGGGVL